ncbi:hypothetical protein ABIA33_001328 [Streptacidiphilus sp. MAP12-16]
MWYSAHEHLEHHAPSDWPTERHRHWPGTSNPHLLMKGQTAMRTHHPCVTTSSLKDAFAAVGLTMQQVHRKRMAVRR